MIVSRDEMMPMLCESQHQNQRTRVVEDCKIVSPQSPSGAMPLTLKGGDNDAQDSGGQGGKAAYDSVKFVRR